MSGPRAAGRVLIVDDEAATAEGARVILRQAGFGDVGVCSAPRTVMDRLAERPHSLVLLDLNMPHVSGRELLPLIHAAHPDTAVVVVTASHDVPTAVDCMRNGAVDYLVKPVAPELLVQRAARALAAHASQVEAARLRRGLGGATPCVEDRALFADILTEDPAMHRVFAQVEAIGEGAAPVLITGETGTGKGLVASALHRAGGRAGELVAVNVAGRSDAAFDDQLFGRAASADGQPERRGAIATAGTGTLFLDHIGELPELQQLKLLRVLEENAYLPMGASAPAPVRARVVAATSADTQQLRPSLYYRLRGYHLRLPPLRERRGDIALLARRFVDEVADQLGRPAPAIGDDVIAALERHEFPGNVRELRAIVRQAVALAGDALAVDDLAGLVPAGVTRTPVVPLMTHAELQALERANLLRALEATRWKVAGEDGAAALLGVNASTLASRIRRLGIERPDV